MPCSRHRQSKCPFLATGLACTATGILTGSLHCMTTQALLLSPTLSGIQYALLTATPAVVFVLQQNNSKISAVNNIFHANKHKCILQGFKYCWVYQSRAAGWTLRKSVVKQNVAPTATQLNDVDQYKCFGSSSRQRSGMSAQTRTAVLGVWHWDSKNVYMLSLHYNKYYQTRCQANSLISGGFKACSAPH